MESIFRMAFFIDLFTVMILLMAGDSRCQLYLQPSGNTHAHFTNDDFVVTCMAPPDSGATRLTWESPHGEIKVTEGRMHVEQVDKLLRLVVLGVIWEDAGKYKCTAVIDDKEVEMIFELIVYRAISFAGSPTEQVATLGSETTVLCHATAEPKPVIAWLHNGSRITRESFPRFQQISSGLKIENVSRVDEGVYTCKAIAVFSLNSQVRNFNITLRVQYLPEWKDSSMEKSYSRMGSVAVLSCEAIAFPLPSFEWLKDDNVVEPTDDFNMTNEPTRSVLHFKVTNQSQFGKYICRARNSVGAAERRISLEEGEKPGVPTVKIFKASINALQLKLFPPPYITLPIVGYRVQYKQTKDDWIDARSQDFDSEDRYIIGQLTPGTEYVMRAAARNEAGLGDYSHEIVQQTDGAFQATVVTDNNAASSSFMPSVHLIVIIAFLLSLRRLYR